MTKMLTLEEVSALTGFSVKAIRYRMAERRFPYTKIGERVRIAEDELARFFQASQVVGAEEAAKEAANFPPRRTSRKTVAPQKKTRPRSGAKKAA